MSILEVIEPNKQYKIIARELVLALVLLFGIFSGKSTMADNQPIIVMLDGREIALNR